MANSALPWLERMLAALPVLLVLAGWATVRGALTTATHSLLAIATLTSLLSLPRAPLLIGIWLATSAVALALLRRQPALGVRAAAASTAVMVAMLAMLGV